MEELVTCPYNVAHSIKRSRLQTHLTKCRMTVPKGDYQTCAYNACHRVPSQEMKMHLDICPDKIAVMLVKREASQLVKSPGGFISQPKVIAPQQDFVEEDWDEDVAGLTLKTYNPTLMAENKRVLRAAPAAPPAERKAFRKAEEKRLKKLKEGASAQKPIPGLTHKEAEEDEEDDRQSTISSLASLNIGGDKLRAFHQKRMSHQSRDQ